MMNLPTTDETFIEKLIPQREPIVMVDELIFYSETELKSAMTVREHNIFYKNKKLLEGGIIEHMAQSVALHTGYKYYINNLAAPIGYIGSIKNIEISFYPKLDDKLITSLQILNEFAGVTMVEITTVVNNKLLAKGEMKTIIAPDQ